MGNKTYLQDSVKWAEWLEDNLVDRDSVPLPECFPCVAVLLEKRVDYVYLTDLLPF